MRQVTEDQDLQTRSYYKGEIGAVTKASLYIW